MDLSRPLQDKSAIAALIPHSGTMSLLERIVHHDAGGIVCEAVSHGSADNPLRTKTLLHVTAGIEYATQAAAVHGALYAGSGRWRGAALTMLSDVAWAVDRLDDIAAPLQVRVEQVAATGDAARYRFEVLAEDRSLIEGVMLVVFTV